MLRFWYQRKSGGDPTLKVRVRVCFYQSCLSFLSLAVSESLLLSLSLSLLSSFSRSPSTPSMMSSAASSTPLIASLPASPAPSTMSLPASPERRLQRRLRTLQRNYFCRLSRPCRQLPPRAVVSSATMLLSLTEESSLLPHEVKAAQTVKNMEHIAKSFFIQIITFPKYHCGQLFHNVFLSCLRFFPFYPQSFQVAGAS